MTLSMPPGQQDLGTEYTHIPAALEETICATSYLTHEDMMREEEEDLQKRRGDIPEDEAIRFRALITHTAVN